MENTVGQMIGKVRQNLSITNTKNEKVQIGVTFDFSMCTLSDLQAWLVGNRVIAFQRPTRALSVSEIKALDGTTVMANECGRKVKSREERIGEMKVMFMNTGMKEDKALTLATVAIDNPDTLEVKESE